MLSESWLEFWVRTSVGFPTRHFGIPDPITRADKFFTPTLSRFPDPTRFYPDFFSTFLDLDNFFKKGRKNTFLLHFWEPNSKIFLGGNFFQKITAGPQKYLMPSHEYRYYEIVASTLSQILVENDVNKIIFIPTIPDFPTRQNFHPDFFPGFSNRRHFYPEKIPDSPLLSRVGSGDQP